MTQQEWLQFLDSLIDYEKVTTYAYDAIKLERMRCLLEALGNPQRAFQSVHVAGSRGKGSVCAMVYQILRASGISAGLYTSPHLISRCERIRFSEEGGEDRRISEDALAGCVAALAPVVKHLSEERRERFTFFEVFTALSFLFFREQGVSVVVVETGMGGRLDATNTLSPLVAAITPISRDHTDKLGKTLTEIAREKAEILKKNALAVVSHQKEESLAEIRRAAGEKGVALREVGTSYAYRITETSRTGSRFEVHGPSGDFPALFLPLPGEHQVRNALVAVAICEALSKKGIRIPVDAVRKGLATLVWPGRFQIVEKDPVLIVDGAQDDASADAFRETFLALFGGRPLRLILGISANKEIDAVCRILCPLAERVIVTEAKNVRALDAARLKEYALPYAAHVETASSVEEALAAARRQAGPRDVIAAAGSLYLVGEALALLDNERRKQLDNLRVAQHEGSHSVRAEGEPLFRKISPRGDGWSEERMGNVMRQDPEAKRDFR